MKDRFDLLIFDWDGTLFDSIGWIVECLQGAAQASGVPVPSEYLARSVIGLSIQHAMEALCPGAAPGVAERLVEHYRRQYMSRPTTPAGLFEGVPELLTGLRERGYRLAVATGKARSGLDHALRGTGTADWFHITRCADETASKPHPKMLFEIMEALDTPPERALMIGDSLHDLRMAESAGIAAIAVGCGANTLDELAELSPLACLEETRALAALLL
jgi:phosphoglycolate phosphatase